jgi:hypothetical protein
LAAISTNKSFRFNERKDKGAAKDEAKPPTPMENFKELTLGLLNVSRTQLHEEQKRYQESRPDKSVKKTPSSDDGSKRTRK